LQGYSASPRGPNPRYMPCCCNVGVGRSMRFCIIYHEPACFFLGVPDSDRPPSLRVYVGPCSSSVLIIFLQPVFLYATCAGAHLTMLDRSTQPPGTSASVLDGSSHIPGTLIVIGSNRLCHSEYSSGGYVDILSHNLTARCVNRLRSDSRFQRPSFAYEQSTPRLLLLVAGIEQHVEVPL
jgi:hypothetical protein